MRGLGIVMLGLMGLGNIAAVLAGLWAPGDSVPLSLLVVAGCLVLVSPEITRGLRR